MSVNLHVDLETLQLIQGPGQRSAVASLRFKRGDAVPLQVTFLENGVTPVTIGEPEVLEIQIGVKPRSRYDAGYLVHDSAWTMPEDGAPSPAYHCTPNFNTLELDAALGIGSDTEIPEITLMGEITWRVAAGLPTSTRTFLVVVENDVNRGTEGVPTSANPPYPAPQNIALVSDIPTFPGDVGPGVISDPTGIPGALAITNIIRISQTNYNAINSPDPAITYIVIPD